MSSIIEYLNNILQNVFDIFPDNWPIECYLKTLHMIKNLANISDIANTIKDDLFKKIPENSLNYEESEQLYQQIHNALRDFINTHMCDICLKTDCKNPDTCNSVLDSGIQPCGGCIDVCRCEIY